MMEPSFRTPFIPRRDPSLVITMDRPVLMLGSCFTDNVGRRMEAAGFNVRHNPMGTLYNPLSIRRSLSMATSGEIVSEGELVECQGAFHHFMFHSSFSSADPHKAVDKMNEAITGTKTFLETDPLLVITLGSSMVYELDGDVVANCHKLPASTFTRRMMTTAEIAEVLITVTQGHDTILTVSPVRHLADGMADNALSKARLLAAARDVADAVDSCHYFPAFEIMNDDLRDYRFYDRDMVHPSDLACDYIFDLFMDTYCDPSIIEQARVNRRNALRVLHRPLIN